MRTLAVCVILLAIASISSEHSAVDIAWVAGTIMLLALTLQRVCEPLGLPVLWGWVLAGLVVGVTGLNIGNPEAATMTLLIRFVGLWAGLLVGIGFGWPAMATRGRFLGLIAASTIIGASIVSLGTGLIADQSWPLALLVGSLACLWGPIVVASLWQDDEAVASSLVGTIVAAVLLTWCIGWLHQTAFLGGDGLTYTARLWLSPATGILIAWTLQHLHVLQRRYAALVLLVVLTGLGAVCIQHFELLSVGVGLGAGLTLSFRAETGRSLERLLGPSRSLTSFLFVALVLSRVDLTTLCWPLAPGLLEIVLIQMIVLFCLRGLIPMLWQPGDAPQASSWLFLPKGIIGLELMLAGNALPNLLGTTDGRLLQQLAIADLLLYGMLAAAVAAAVLRQPQKQA